MQENYSVLMSVYINEKPEYLKESIESILNQSKKANEIVIIEDGILTQELSSVIDEYRKKYINLFKIIKIAKNSGLGNALAIGLQACKNEYVARMDSDDIACKTRCEEQIEILNQNPDIDVVGSSVAEFENSINNIKSYKIVPENNEEIYKYAKRRNPCNHSSIMMRKSKVLMIGNYREKLYFEDYDLWVRMLQEGYKFYNIQKVLVYMRTEDNFYARRGRT